MKKINKYLIMGAAISGMAGLTACSSETDAPDAPGNVTAVKTQFALNIPRANGGTRMTADNTQANKNFLGMDEIAMLTFSEQPTASSTSTSLFGLGEIESGAMNETNTSSKIYSNVNVPVGTTHFLFYAHAPQGTDATGKFQTGYIDLDIPDDNNDGKIATSGISATLQGVTTNTSDNEASQITTVLNRVAKTRDWSSYPNADLLNFYNAFVKLKAGSATSVCKELERLYNELGGVLAGDQTAQTVVSAIRANITDGGTFTYDATNNTLSTSLTYPQNINLPDGAVMLNFTTSNDFEYASTSNNVGTSFMGLNAADVCFPASIYYFQSSDLAASAQALDTNQWPTSTTNWNSSAPWLNTDGSLATGWTNSVNAATRSIAMRQNINYGVASLYLQAKCNASSLQDNHNLSTMGTFTGSVDIPSDGLKITGLLIGGQPAKVGYDFQPATTGEQFAKVVYDKDFNTTDGKNFAQNSTTNYSAENYTVVLPNEIAGDVDQNSVNIAVEFENNTGADFRGADGIVPAGGKFYLVGKLDPNGQTLSGKTKPAVFMSDYQTTARINVSSLANAYNTIPDLRSTKMQLGISVDLTWQQGLSFDVELN